VDTEAFSTTVTAISFTWLGLWWVVVQAAWVFLVSTMPMSG
jgi:hypothetical protein